MSEIVCIFGKRGSGKSTLAKRLLRKIPEDRRVAHDPLSEHVWRERIVVGEVPPTIRQGDTIILDEADLIAPPTGYQVDWLRKIVHLSRHYEVDIIVISRRPANIHRDLTALATRVFLGPLSEPRDLAYIEKAWGQSALACRRLPQYQFLELRV